MTDVHTLASAQHGNPIVWIIIVLLGFVVVFGPFILLATWSTKRQARRRFAQIPNTQTEAEIRTQKAMEAALRNTRQQAPPAAPASLASRLTQLDDALKAGLITQQDHAKKRADIIASA